MSSDGSNPPERNQARADADKGREPRLVSGQAGRRFYSLAALVERIEAAFLEEHREDSTQLREADTPTKRLKLVLATADYVLTVESVQLSSDEKADLIRQAYSSLFGYGPLDAWLTDERVTTISLEGADKASVRYGHGELVSLGPLFLDEEHFRRVINRLLTDAHAELRADHPYLEVGLTIHERPVCVNVVGPPVAFQLSADIRVHPKKASSLDDLIQTGFMTAEAGALLKTLVNSPHGILIVGEPESGKTTLLSALAQAMPQPDQLVAVERAGELRLPAGAQRRVVKWPVGEQPGLSFADQVGNALEKKPRCILLDEVRADEAAAVAALLGMADPPRQIWSFRGAIFAKRLQSALGMLARRADPNQGETLARALYERLPFVITVNRINDQLRLWSMGEWQLNDYTPLMEMEMGQLKRTHERFSREL